MMRRPDASRKSTRIPLAARTAAMIAASCWGSRLQAQCPVVASMNGRVPTVRITVEPARGTRLISAKNWPCLAPFESKANPARACTLPFCAIRKDRLAASQVPPRSSATHWPPAKSNWAAAAGADRISARPGASAWGRA